MFIPLPVYSEVGHSASGMRPGNPTPAHAAGQGSPAPVRPSAPTPAHAQKGVPGRPGENQWIKYSCSLRTSS